MISALRTISLLAIFASVAFAADGSPHANKVTWPNTQYAKVIGYRFKLPSDDAKDPGPVPSGFSLLNKSGVDTKQLAELTVKSVELTKQQIADLLRATFSPTHRVNPAACYDPHHIFIFYSDAGTALSAIEVCFSCTGIATTPDTPKSKWYRHDFVALARLTDALGLWLEHRTVAQYEALRKEQDKP